MIGYFSGYNVVMSEGKAYQTGQREGFSWGRVHGARKIGLLNLSN